MADRRQFLKVSGVAGASLVIGTGLAHASVSEFELEEATIATLREAIQSGQMSSKRITEGYLKRIAEIDKRLNSIIEINPDALAIADHCDQERLVAKRVFSPLHGIPILIK